MEPAQEASSDQELHPEAGTRDSGTQHAASRPRGQELSVRGFAKAVWKFSKLNTGAGYHHEKIAQFLSELMSIPDDRFEPSKFHEDFLSLYRFIPATGSVSPQIPTITIIGPSSRETTDISTRWQLEEPNHFRSCHKFHQYKVLSLPESPGQMLFLKGYPSPEWLGLIGSRYRVDPEFFSRFLDFRSTDNLSNRTSVPSLPSCQWNIIELSLNTIGLMNLLACHGHQNDSVTVRRQAAAALAEIHGRILRNAQVPVGSTMIRAVNVLDQTHFVIEQRIAICLQPPENDRGWMVLVWTDSGSRPGVDFVEGPLASALGLSQSLKRSLLPIVNYKPMMGLNSHLFSKHTPNLSTNEPQSVPALYHEYGRSLRTNLAARDPFYCLTEVFALVASSEKQFLNLMEMKLENAIFDHGHRPHTDGLETLRYFNALLYRHARRIKTTISSLNSTCHNKWPKAEEEPTKRARAEVEQDFVHLYEHADALYQHCQAEIKVLMNSMAILESEKAITQAGRMEQLTLLAFFFVPISFVSSFFSMNVPLLANPPMWSWFVVSCIMLVPSIGFYLFNDKLRNTWQRLRRKWFS